MRQIMVLLMLPAALGLVAPDAWAATIDQSYQPSGALIDNVSLSADVGSEGNGTKVEAGQTFLAGLAGRITEVDLSLMTVVPGSGLLLEIVKTTPDGMPSQSPSDLLGAALATPGSTGLGPISVAFQFGNTGPMVAPGESLALVLVAPGSGLYDWVGALGNPYPQGTIASLGGIYGNQWSIPANPVSQADLGFTTFVQPTPEPTTCLVIVAGIAAWAARRRIR